MIRFPKIDILATGSMIAGLAGSATLSAFGDALDTLAPGYGKKAVAAVSVASFAAGLLVRTFTSNKNTQAAALTGPVAPPTP